MLKELDYELDISMRWWNINHHQLFLDVLYFASKQIAGIEHWSCVHARIIYYLLTPSLSTFNVGWKKATKTSVVKVDNWFPPIRNTVNNSAFAKPSFIVQIIRLRKCLKSLLSS